MNYVVLCFLAFVSGPVRVYAQAIRFEQDSLREVMARARQQKKPVFVLLAPPLPPVGLSRRQQAIRRQSGLNEPAPAVIAMLNQGVLNKELAFGRRESAAVARKQYRKCKSERCSRRHLASPTPPGATYTVICFSIP